MVSEHVTAKAAGYAHVDKHGVPFLVGFTVGLTRSQWILSG